MGPFQYYITKCAPDVYNLDLKVQTHNLSSYQIESFKKIIWYRWFSGGQIGRDWLAGSLKGSPVTDVFLDLGFGTFGLDKKYKEYSVVFKRDGWGRPNDYVVNKIGLAS